MREDFFLQDNPLLSPYHYDHNGPLYCNEWNLRSFEPELTHFEHRELNGSDTCTLKFRYTNPSYSDIQTPSLE